MMEVVQIESNVIVLWYIRIGIDFHSVYRAEGSPTGRGRGRGGRGRGRGRSRAPYGMKLHNLFLFSYIWSLLLNLLWGKVLPCDIGCVTLWNLKFTILFILIWNLEWGILWIAGFSLV